MTRCGPGARASRTSARALRIAILVGLAAVASGCQLFPQAPSPPASAEPPVDAPSSAAEPRAATPVDTVLELLQTGRRDEARRLLSELSEQTPNARLVEKLTRLVEQPVESLVPPPYREIRVRRGQTLSSIAAEATGDPLMFIALARLNDIDVPSRLPVGAVLKVPDATAAAQVESTPDENAADMTTEAETVAEFLALSGQPAQARDMLRRLVERGEASEQGRRRFVELTLDEARNAIGRDDYRAAVTLLEDASEVLGEDEVARARLESLRDRARFEDLSQRAAVARERGELTEAYALASEAVALAPDGAAARRLAAELRESLVEELHNEALVAWRNRDVDRAIRTWETLLEAVPEFEPAEVYLERARRLRSRLDSS